MKIYVVASKEGYELCHPINQDDFEKINVLINGVSRQSDWQPIEMQTICEDEGQKLLESDSPWLGSHALIFTAKARDVIGPLLLQYGELLPLTNTNRSELSMFNPTRVIDALDENASDVVRFGEGRIMMIRRYVFRPSVVGDIDVFKIPNLRVSPTFVSQRFVELWRAAKLRGLEFVECTLE